MSNIFMENDTPITPPTAAEAADLNQKWNAWDKKQKRNLVWRTVAGLTAVFGLIAAGASTHFSDDKTPGCSPNTGPLEINEGTAATAPLQDGSAITLEDGSVCSMRFTP